VKGRALTWSSTSQGDQSISRWDAVSIRKCHNLRGLVPSQWDLHVMKFAWVINTDRYLGGASWPLHESAFTVLMPFVLQGSSMLTTWRT